MPDSDQNSGLTLKDYVDVKIEGIEKATNLAKDALERRQTDTNISNREYVDAKIKSAERESEARVLGIEKAYDIARISMDKRLEGMNEFRGALKDQTGLMIRREEFDIQHAALKVELGTKQHYIEEELKSVHLEQATLKGKASQSYVNITFLVSCIAIAIAIIDLFVRK